MDVVKLPLFLGVHDGVEITALHKIIFEHVEYIMKDVCVRKQALDWVFFLVFPFSECAILDLSRYFCT